MLYKLNGRITIRRWTTVKNEFGGLIPLQVASWDKWAEVRASSWVNLDIFNTRPGRTNDEYDQSKWEYDTTIIMRYEKERPTRSNDTIEYEGQVYTINSIAVNTEYSKNYEVLKCTKIDQDINDDAPMDTDNIKVANYTATGGEYIITLPELIGKNVFGAFKDGIQFVVKTSGSANGKEVVFNVSTGVLTWGQLFEAGEVATILYY